MSRIGTFRKSDGEYHGAIFTLALQAMSVGIVPVPGASTNAPSHRVMMGEIEIGAAWAKTTKDDRPYLSVKLDDPSFTAPIFAQLFDGDDGEYELVWSRQRRGD